MLQCLFYNLTQVSITYPTVPLLNKKKTILRFIIKKETKEIKLTGNCVGDGTNVSVSSSDERPIWTVVKGSTADVG